MINHFPSYFTQKLRENSKVIQLKKGEYLFRTEQKVYGLYFVLSGELKAIRPLHDEADAVMMRSVAGEYFAESAIATDHYSCDGICVKQAEVTFIASSYLNNALHNPEFAKAFFLANAANARRQCSRYERVRLRSAKDRVLHLLACERGIDGVFIWPASLAELAGELAMEPETLYRVLAELEEQGTIHRQKRSFKLIS